MKTAQNIIDIKSVYRSKDGKRMNFDIDIVNLKENTVSSDTLWFEVSEKYKAGFCDLIDGVVVSFLPYAVRDGYNFRSSFGISEKLYYNLTYHLLPQFAAAKKTGGGYYLVEIEAPIINDTGLKPYAVACGMSCGVDSLTTFFEYTNDCELDSYKLTHMTFFENGAHHMGDGGNFDRMEELFLEQAAVAEAFCKKTGYDLITVRSNIHRFLTERMLPYRFEYKHTYLNVGFAMILQGLIKTYYYSSAFNVDKFNFDLSSDTAEYEKYLMQFFNTQIFSVYSSNKAMSRIEKTEYISRYPESYDSLLVCFMSDKNCGKCLKCARTLVTLDLLGVLDKFTGAFDTEYYKKHRNTYYQNMCYRRHYDDFMRDLYKLAKEKNVKIPLGCKVKGNTQYCMRVLYDKVKNVRFIRKAAYRHKPM